MMDLHFFVTRVLEFFLLLKEQFKNYLVQLFLLQQYHPPPHPLYTLPKNDHLNLQGFTQESGMMAHPGTF